MTALPALYSFRRCPYAMRARLAIDASGVEVEHREILLKDKPAAMLQASPKGTVPVLVLSDGKVVDESLDIMFWALQQNDPEAWLPVADTQLALIARNDGEFKQALDRYKYATRYEDGDEIEQRELAMRSLIDLDALLRELPFVHGSTPGLADHAIFPFVRQFANTDRVWFDAQPVPALQTWLDHFLNSDRFARIMAKRPLWDDEIGQ